MPNFLDFEKLKIIGNLAFEIAEGEEIKIPSSPIRMKIRPPAGYQDQKNLADRLKTAGIRAEKLSKEEMLFLSCYGEAKQGIKPYLKLDAYNHDIIAGLVAGIMVALGKIS